MKPVPKPENVETIAVRLTNWVGDCVMNTPFLVQLRELFPRARIICLGRKNVVGLLRPHPAVDEVLEIDDKSWAGFRQAAKMLRALKVDLGFLMPNSLKAAALFVAGGVRCRVGYNRDARRLLLTHPIELRPDDLAVHEVRYYLRLLHPWMKECLDPPALKLAVSEEEQQAMAQWLAGRGIGSEYFVVGVNPAAFFGTAKRWLPERYAQAADALAGKRNGRVIVTGLPTERDVAEEVCKAGGDLFYNAAGEMSLRELMAFLHRCDLFLTNDSGAMHIGAALGTPLVAVFGSTDWVTTAPFAPQATQVRVETPCAPCILRHCPIDHRCMTGVTAEMVVERAEQLLAEESKG